MVDSRTTSDKEEFIAFIGPKINYSKTPLDSEFFIKAHDLLFDQGISDVEIVVQDWEGVPCFFSTSDNSHVPFDIFAAGFYMLSRYEEYLPHVKDKHGRYPATESIGYKYHFLNRPVVDVWIMKLKQLMEEHYPSFQFKKRNFEAIPVIDVPVIYNYRKKGIIRTLASTFLDLVNLELKTIFERFQVLLGFKRDPFDNFDRLITLHKQKDINAVYFFLMGDYSHYDKNISVTSPSFKKLVKSVADYSVVSLMASYESFNHIDLLKKERKRLIQFINRPVKRVRWRFNRLNIPESYRMMAEAEFNEDYTMGYSNYMGFRAGTCTPFNFYDISFEVQIPIKVTPFCVSYAVLQRTSNLRTLRSEILALKSETEQVNGIFVAVFTNEILNPDLYRPIWEFYVELFSKNN